ncbi:cbb3-type cytochrome oxidase assembly protein CcoS [Marinicella meishanensis]|uniref:cbb3-type cytochrome oxidase assembly protein CcoS n=1 Tax=Marinicella meishanensis TaxID=2873263 RepID=UPI001CBE3E83|nr:cbb3-type cytochrome oxidase assembly protein CcoS [Marinicella sp. NBU2979]
MNMVFVLVLLSLVLAGVAVWAIFWAINKNQFDDLDSPAYAILEDDPKPNQPTETTPPDESKVAKTETQSDQD